MAYFYLFIFFFLMIRRPPRSTLFPYTDALPISRFMRARRNRQTLSDRPCHTRPLGRSEEHTSKLQSRENLVCRLLLEKKTKSLRHRLRSLVTASVSLATMGSLGLVGHRPGQPASRHGPRRTGSNVKDVLRG